MQKQIAIFASGSGTNAENIIKYFKNSEKATVKIVLTNNSNAGVIKRAQTLNIETEIFDKTTFYSTSIIDDLLKEKKIDIIILAGFLWKIPERLIKLYPNKMVNIHPSLLPKYGGKGMYGNNVHKAVIQNGEIKSGITIHYVNEHYDEGDIIFQAECNVMSSDTPDSLAIKIHTLEYEHFPKTIHKLIESI